MAGNADADDNDEESLQELNVREVSRPDIEVTYGDVHEVVEVAGVMREYLRVVVQHLCSEISGEAFKNVNNQWCLFMARKNIGWLRNLFCWSLQVLTLTKWKSSGATMLMALTFSQNYQYIFELTIRYGPETNEYRML